MIDELKSLRAMLLAERAKSGDGSHRLQPAHTVSVELSDHSADYSGGSDRVRSQFGHILHQKPESCVGPVLHST